MKKLLLFLLLGLPLIASAQVRTYTINGGAGSSNSASAPMSTTAVRLLFSADDGVNYFSNEGKFTIQKPVVNTQILNYLKAIDGYAPGKVLSTQGDGFVWVTATTSTSGGSGTTVAPSVTPYDSILVYADSTKMRIDSTIMSDLFVNTPADLRNACAGAQTNKRIIITFASSTTGEFVLTGAWDNVYLRPANNVTTTLSRADYGTVMVLNGSALKRRIRISRIKFSPTYTGSGNPILWSTELVGFDGLEIDKCEITSNGQGTYNAFNISQYSTNSQSGATSKNLFFHHNYVHDIGRAVEILCQGYDKVRLFNVVITNNQFHNLGLNTEYGFGTSYSGLIKYIYDANNYCLNTKKISKEAVNIQYAIFRNNRMLTTNNTAGYDQVGYGVSDDGVGTTRHIFIEGALTNVNVKGRPFYIYDAKYVNISGGTWKGNQRIDMKAQYCTFANMNITIHSTNDEPGWLWDAPTGGVASAYNTASNCTITSAGAVAAGFLPSRTTIELAALSHHNTLTNMTTIIGKKANGTWANSGVIFNLGSNNTVTGNTFSQAAN